MNPRISSSTFYDMESGVHFLNTKDYEAFIDKPAELRNGKAIWLYNRSSKDERIGLLLIASSEKIFIGRTYGGSELKWSTK